VRSYIVLVLCNNEVHYIEPFIDLTDAKAQAISLANEWHKQEGIESFGLHTIQNTNELAKYYTSDAYFNSNDSAHIIIEEITLTKSN
jgi:hypothetical protein